MDMSAWLPPLRELPRSSSPGPSTPEDEKEDLSPLEGSDLPGPHAVDFFSPVGVIGTRLVQLIRFPGVLPQDTWIWMDRICPLLTGTDARQVIYSLRRLRRAERSERPNVLRALRSEHINQLAWGRAPGQAVTPRFAIANQLRAILTLCLRAGTFADSTWRTLGWRRLQDRNDIGGLLVFLRELYWRLLTRFQMREWGTWALQPEPRLAPPWLPSQCFRSGLPGWEAGWEFTSSDLSYTLPSAHPVPLNSDPWTLFRQFYHGMDSFRSDGGAPLGSIMGSVLELHMRVCRVLTNNVIQAARRMFLGQSADPRADSVILIDAIQEYAESEIGDYYLIAQIFEIILLRYRAGLSMANDFLTLPDLILLWRERWLSFQHILDDVRVPQFDFLWARRPMRFHAIHTNRIASISGGSAGYDREARRRRRVAIRRNRRTSTSSSNGGSPGSQDV